VDEECQVLGVGAKQAGCLICHCVDAPGRWYVVSSDACCANMHSARMCNRCAATLALDDRRHVAQATMGK